MVLADWPQMTSPGPRGTCCLEEIHVDLWALVPVLAWPCLGTLVFFRHSVFPSVQGGRCQLALCDPWKLPPWTLTAPRLPTCSVVLCCPHEPWDSCSLGAGMDTGSALPHVCGSFLLVPQRHLLDSLCSPAGVRSRVRVGVTPKVPLGPLSWGLLLSKTKPVCVLMGLGTWFQVCHFSIRLIGQKVRSRVSQEIWICRQCLIPHLG